MLLNDGPNTFIRPKVIKVEKKVKITFLSKFSLFFVIKSRIHKMMEYSHFYAIFIFI